jgi:NTE family protein
VARGEALIRAGDPPDALFIVHHGSFDVLRADADMEQAGGGPLARLHAGAVIGEIGFFAHTARTATVVASRDAAVFELDRASYQSVVATAPEIVPALLAAVARRLADTTRRVPPTPRATEGRTFAIVPAGVEPIPPLFLQRLRRVLSDAGVGIVDTDAVRARFGAAAGDASLTHWLNDLELDGRHHAFLADAALTEWTQRCVRQADTVVLVTRGDAPASALTATETFCCDVHAPESRRLVRVHDRRRSVAAGTPAWLQRLHVFMHHHVALQDDDDVRSLVRFLTGRAIGYVEGGGGGLGLALIGIHDAFLRRGAVFDMYVGVSIGALVAAGHAMLRTAEQIDDHVHDIAVTARSLKRYTLPRYALLDHKALETAYARNAGPATRIEDCWRPFVAVATNLSTRRMELMRTGLLWHAMRASTAIPGVLPPFYTDDGMALVDGGVMNNAPLEPIRRLKSGPNLLVHFGRTAVERFAVRNQDIPGRWRLLAALLLSFGRALPRAPSAISVVLRSLGVHQRYDFPPTAHDLVLAPPRFPGSSFLNLDGHAAVLQASRAWALETIDRLAADQNAALAAILDGGREAGSEGAGSPEDAGPSSR